MLFLYFLIDPKVSVLLSVNVINCIYGLKKNFFRENTCTFESRAGGGGRGGTSRLKQTLHYMAPRSPSGNEEPNQLNH